MKKYLRKKKKKKKKNKKKIKKKIIVYKKIENNISNNSSIGRAPDHNLLMVKKDKKKIHSWLKFSFFLPHKWIIGKYRFKSGLLAKMIFFTISFLKNYFIHYYDRIIQNMNNPSF